MSNKKAELEALDNLILRCEEKMLSPFKGEPKAEEPVAEETETVDERLEDDEALLAEFYAQDSEGE